MGRSGDPIWLLINLDRSADRLAKMERHLGALGIGHTRVPAIDGQNLPVPLPGFDPALYRRCHGRVARSGEIGCFLSHLQAMTAFLDSTARHAVILEDDVELNTDTRALAEALCANDAPDDWDMVKLERHHEGPVLPLRDLFGPYRLGAPVTRPTGAAAYIVNRRAAQAYLARLLPIRVPFDHAFDRGWALHLRTRMVTPCPARALHGAHGSLSTISIVPPAKATGLSKLPALAWRSRNETMRAIFAVSAYLGRMSRCGRVAPAD